MVSSSKAVPFRPAPRRRTRLVTWAVVACVAAVLIEVGAVTNGFGLAPLLFPPSKPGPGPGPPGPNPNPYNMTIFGVISAITYAKDPDSFPSLQGVNLCNRCPELPPENTNYTPPVAGVWFYFNVTNDGLNTTNISNFTLTTSGASPHLFKLVGVVCCSPKYEEVVTTIDFVHDETFGLGGLATASSVPDTAVGGYTLYFNVTSP